MLFRKPWATIHSGVAIRWMLLLMMAACTVVNAQPQRGPSVRLHGHVPSALQYASRLPRTTQAAGEPLVLTIMLNWSDPAGFEAFSSAFDDPTSPSYHHPITADELTARFGPTEVAYDTVKGYLQQQGFTLVEGSANRLTLTVRGTRAQAERLFDVSIDDYQLGSRQFHANDNDPAIPEALAPLIRSVSGFSNLAQPRPAISPSPSTPASIATAYDGGVTPPGIIGYTGLPPGINGAGQTIGLIEFDNFVSSDVSIWLNLAGLPANLINQVSTFSILGGTPPSGGQTEVLLDIDAALGTAPGANIVVFVAPPGADNGFVIATAINHIASLRPGGYGGIISTSWGKCEAEVSDSENDSMEVLLRSASLYGVTFFAAAGDNGSTCTSPQGTWANTVSFPANAPHAVAVGGTALQVGAGNSYQGESWWTGGLSGGFGVSRHFPRPSYQNPFTTASGRSVPDVSAEASNGILVCQAFAGVSPNCTGSNGTSLSAPLWAGYWALVSQAQAAGTGGLPISASGGYLYNVAPDFHQPATFTGVGNDFSHVGLGSPDITRIAAYVAGPPSIVNVSPASGPAPGGTTVTITGTDLIGVTSVLFAGTPAPWFQVVSESQIVTSSPAVCHYNACYNGDLELVTLTGRIYGKFSYLSGVTSINPTSGPMGGGTPVMVTGFGFPPGNRISFLFDSTPVLSGYCSSDRQCTVGTPAHSPGPVQVTTGSGLPGPQFTFLGPSITGLSTRYGAEIGGTYVDIIGTGLSPTMIVKFGNTPVTSGGVTCSGDTDCAVFCPPGKGTVPVIATVNGIPTAQTPADLFTYEPFPYGTMSPNSGTGDGGTKIIVTGGNFSTATGATTFMFGPNATPVAGSCLTTTACTVISPAISQYSFLVPVTVTVTSHAAGKTLSLTSALGNFTYTSGPPGQPGTIADLTFNPVGISFGDQTTGTLTVVPPLSGQAMTIALTCDRPDLATVPASITVPAGRTTASFTVTTVIPPGRLPRTVTVYITASVGSNTRIGDFVLGYTPQ